MSKTESPASINLLTSAGNMREVLSVAWPFMLSTGLFSLVLFCDRLLLFWHSEIAASAAMTSGSIYWSMVCIPVGTLGYTSTFVAQYAGANRPSRGFHTVAQGVWIAFAAIPFFVVCAWQCHNMYSLFDHSAELLATETTYFRWLLPGAIAMVFRAPVTGLFAGLGKMRILLITDLVGAIINIAVDYVLIFGKFGLPSMGVTGAGIASSLSLLVTTILLYWLGWRHIRRALGSNVDAQSFDSNNDEELEIPDETTTTWWRFQWSESRRLLYFGLPAGIQLSIESFSFSVIMLYVGDLGENALAATTLALGVNLLAFVPMNGLGMALGVLVGRYLAAENMPAVNRSIRNGLMIGVCYTSIFVVAYGFCTDWTLNLYSLQSPPERFENLRPILRPLLQFIAAYAVFDALQIIFVGIIKGAGDTVFVLAGAAAVGITVVGIGVTLSTLINATVFFWWSVITAWVFAMAVVFSLRFLQGKWREMRVIEPTIEVK